MLSASMVAATNSLRPASAWWISRSASSGDERAAGVDVSAGRVSLGVGEAAICSGLKPRTRPRLRRAEMAASSALRRTVLFSWKLASACSR